MSPKGPATAPDAAAPEAPKPAAPPRWDTAGKVVSVCIGVTDYPGDATDAPAAAPDAARFQSALASLYGKRYDAAKSRLLVAPAGSQKADAPDAAALPTADRISATIEAGARATTPDDILVVYLSGNGTPGTFWGAGWNPADARTGLSIAEALDRISAAPARRVMLVLDTPRAYIPEGAWEALRRAGKEGVLALACQADEASRADHYDGVSGSVFTHHLMRAMSGATDAKTGDLTVADLQKYVSGQVMADTGQAQTPVFATSDAGATVVMGRRIREAEPLKPLILPAAPVAAAPAEKPAAPIEKPDPMRRWDVGGMVYAVSVGVGSYPNSGLTLPGAAAGAAHFFKALKTLYGERFAAADSVLLTAPSPAADDAPTFARIAAALKSVAAKTGPEDILAFYFAGSAATFSDQSQDRRLLATDADPKRAEANPLTTGIVASLLANAPARRVLIALDCPYASIPDIAWDAFAAYNKTALLFAATSPKEMAYENGKGGARADGVFTEALINALAPAALPEGGPLTVGALFARLRPGVRERTDDSQTPRYKASPPEKMGDIVLGVVPAKAEAPK